MADIDQVIAQIRFGLDQLSSRNAFHEFEHMCRHLARARICSNILPATGPVSGGGDQGRDFESFRSYIQKSTLKDSAFVGLVANKAIAFACSLQDGKTISRKIHDDVKTISTSGTAIEEVHFFAATDIPVAKRHDLQKQIKTAFGIHLEIHDGQAISELLADHEVFWIAEKYLGIPAEIFPREESDDWYAEQQKKWIENKSEPQNFADFEELRLAGRQALDDENLRQDLKSWVDLIKDHFLDAPSDELRLRAIYEAAVLSLRGFSDLSSFEPSLRWFFEKISEMNLARLEDAGALLQYVGASINRAGHEIPIDEISSWRSTLSGTIDEQLAASEIHPYRRATLLKLKGWESIYIDPANPHPPDFEAAIEWWLQAIDLVQYAPLFPLRHFAYLIGQTLELIIQIRGARDVPPSFYELTSKIDALLASRFGGFASAESSFQRSQIFAKADAMILAIDSLHESKLDWFANETLERSLTMMLFLSRLYYDLGLFFAAKYYAYAVTFIAFHQSDLDVKKLASIGLMRAATWDYIIGAFRAFLITTSLETMLQSAYADKPGDFEESEVQSITYHLLMLKVIAEKTYPAYLPRVDELISRLLSESLIEEYLPQFRKALGDGSPEEIVALANEQMNGCLFDDSHSRRHVTWRSLGIHWIVEWDATHPCTAAAEEFLAILQIFIVELSRLDLALLKTSISIEISREDSERPRATAIPSNEGRSWHVALPNTPRSNVSDVESQREVFNIVTQILFEVSLLPTEQFFDAMEQLFKAGLTGRIFVAGPYQELFSEFVPANEFEAFDSIDSPPDIFLLPEPEEHLELAWISSLGPTYELEKMEELLRNRYQNSLIDFQLVTTICSDVNFKEIVDRLHALGWLDWHIIASITLLAMNYQMRGTPLPSSKEEAQKQFDDVRSGRYRWQPVPAQEFSTENLLFNLRVSMLSTLKLLGLESHQDTPDFPAIDAFLRTRYNYWTDDVDHDDPFSDFGTKKI